TADGEDSCRRPARRGIRRPPAKIPPAGPATAVPADVPARTPRSGVDANRCRPSSTAVLPAPLRLQRLGRSDSIPIQRAQPVIAVRSSGVKLRRRPHLDFPRSHWPSAALISRAFGLPASPYRSLTQRLGQLVFWRGGNGHEKSQRTGANPMKLKIDTIAVSFVCTRAPEQRL